MSRLDGRDDLRRARRRVESLRAPRRHGHAGAEALPRDDPRPVVVPVRPGIKSADSSESVAYEVVADADGLRRRARGAPEPGRRRTMSTSTNTAPRDRVRTYHPELDLVGVERARRRRLCAVRRRASPGCRPRDAVDRPSGGPDGRDRQHVLLIVIASGEASGLLDEALDWLRRRRPPAPPSCSRTSSSPCWKAAHAGRRLQSDGRLPGRAGSSRCSPKGGDGQDGHGADSWRRASRDREGQAHAAVHLASSSATPRSCSGSSPTRPSTTSSSHRASWTPRSSR